MAPAHLPKSPAETQILIVEDEGIVAHGLRRILEDLGYSVAGVAASSCEALAAASSVTAHLALMDITIRGSIDGIELAGVMRRRWGVPVVYITAHSDEATLSRVEKSQPFGFIRKPFRAPNIKATLEFALQRISLETQLQERAVNAQSLFEAVNTVAGLENSAARRQAQEALRKAELLVVRNREDLAEFHYALNHDLPEPVRTVRLISQLLQRQPLVPTNAKRERILKEISAACGEILDVFQKVTPDPSER